MGSKKHKYYGKNRAVRCTRWWSIIGVVTTRTDTPKQPHAPKIFDLIFDFMFTYFCVLTVYSKPPKTVNYLISSLEPCNCEACTYILQRTDGSAGSMTDVYTLPTHVRSRGRENTMPQGEHTDSGRQRDARSLGTAHPNYLLCSL